MKYPFQRCATQGMVPFENLIGVAMEAKGLMVEIQILRKKMSPLQSLLTCLTIF